MCLKYCQPHLSIIFTHRYVKCMAVRPGIFETRTDSSYWRMKDGWGGIVQPKEDIQPKGLTWLELVSRVRNRQFSAYSPLLLDEYETGESNSDTYKLMFSNNFK